MIDLNPLVLDLLLFGPKSPNFSTSLRKKIRTKIFFVFVFLFFTRRCWFSLSKDCLCGFLVLILCIGLKVRVRLWGLVWFRFCIGVFGIENGSRSLCECLGQWFKDWPGF